MVLPLKRTEVIKFRLVWKNIPGGYNGLGGLGITLLTRL